MKNKYSIEEIDILNSNPNVILVKYGRQIEYSPDFKKWAVRQSKKHPELTANEIFILGGFDPIMIGERTAEARIRDWKKKENSKKEEPKNYDNEVLEYVKQNNMLLQYLISRFDKIISIKR